MNFHSRSEDSNFRDDSYNAERCHLKPIEEPPTSRLTEVIYACLFRNVNAFDVGLTARRRNLRLPPIPQVGHTT